MNITELFEGLFEEINNKYPDYTPTGFDAEHHLRSKGSADSRFFLFWGAHAARFDLDKANEEIEIEHQPQNNDFFSYKVKIVNGVISLYDTNMFNVMPYIFDGVGALEEDITQRFINFVKVQEGID